MTQEHQQNGSSPELIWDSELFEFPQAKLQSPNKITQGIESKS